MVAAYIHGSDEKTRMMRRNIIRYCVLSQALVFRDISMRVRKRFPTIEAIVASGYYLNETNFSIILNIRLKNVNKLTKL